MSESGTALRGVAQQASILPWSGPTAQKQALSVSLDSRSTGAKK